MADSGVEGSSGTLEHIGEEAGVDAGLLVDEVQLATIGLLDGQVVGQDFGFEAFCEVVLKLKLGIKGV